MPNWCRTQINFYDEEKELNKFDNLLTQWTSKNCTENDFGLDWLGNIVGNSGIGTWSEKDGNFFDKDNKKVPCRGTIISVDLLENCISIDVEDAWCPQLKMWEMLRQKHLPNASMMYQAIECGTEIYDTNDESLRDKFIIDVWDNFEKYEDTIFEAYDCCVDESYVVEALQQLLNTEETNLNVLLEEFYDSEFSNDISINKWDFVEPETYM